MDLTESYIKSTPTNILKRSTYMQNRKTILSDFFLLFFNTTKTGPDISGLTRYQHAVSKTLHYGQENAYIKVIVAAEKADILC